MRYAGPLEKMGNLKPLKPIAAALAGRALMGCAGINANIVLITGTLRVEPHPIHDDKVQVISLHRAPLYVDSLGRGRGTADAHRATVDALFGDKCLSAPIIQEATAQVSSLLKVAALRCA